MGGEDKIFMLKICQNVQIFKGFYPQLWVCCEPGIGMQWNRLLRRTLLRSTIAELCFKVYVFKSSPAFTNL